MSSARRPDRSRSIHPRGPAAPALRERTRAVGLLASLGALVACVAVSLAPDAEAGWKRQTLERTVRIDPAASRPASDAAWAVTDSGSLEADDHLLRPRVVAAPAAALTLSLPTGGEIAMRPIGLGDDSTAPLAWPAGQGGLALDPLAPRRASVRDAWVGVDEELVLLNDGVKHDLLLDESAVGRLSGAGLRASWLVEVPPGHDLALESGAAVVRNLDGAEVARIPAPVVQDGASSHPLAGPARLDVTALAEGAHEVSVVVDGAWLSDPARSFPLRIDPTLVAQPANVLKTGAVSETGFRQTGAIVAGSLADLGLGSDVRGYAEFDLAAVPAGADVTSVILEAWVNNHDNTFDPAVPTLFEAKLVPVGAEAPVAILHDAIAPLGDGAPYVSEELPRTGDAFCPDSFTPYAWNLGSAGVADLTAQLAAGWITLGFVADTTPNPFFNHVDVQGYDEDVAGLGCSSTTLPGSRISLLVSFDEDVTCAPRNHGFWHRYCLGADAIDPGRSGGGDGPGPSPQHSDLPAGLLAAADAAVAPYGLTACQALDEGPFSDPRLAALRELATIELNVAAGMLKLGCEVELAPVVEDEGLTVGDAVSLMLDRLADGSVEALHEARWIGEHVVNGEALR